MAASALVLIIFALCNTAGANPSRVFGWIEEGLLLPEKVSVKIKLDTGALTSSMDAKDLERFERNGEKWVRFKVEVKDSDTGRAASIPFERRVERNVKVRGAGGAEHRPVVVMKMCIGNQLLQRTILPEEPGKNAPSGFDRPSSTGAPRSGGCITHLHSGAQVRESRPGAERV